jgi:hypothetical protein
MLERAIIPERNHGPVPGPLQAGSGPEPPQLGTGFINSDGFLLTRGRYGGKSVHFWPSEAVLANLFHVPGTPGSVTVGQLSTGYPSRSVPGLESGPGNDPYQSFILVYVLTYLGKYYFLFFLIRLILLLYSLGKYQIS